MEELYTQKLGKDRIVSVIAWTKKNAIIEDLATELKYTISWEIFFKFHKKLEPTEIDTDKYIGPDLTFE